jgi:hypothetical protein
VSEGPEVRRAADKIAEAVLGRSIIDLQCKFMKKDMREKNHWIESLISRYLWQKYHTPFFK